MVSGTSPPSAHRLIDTILLKRSVLGSKTALFYSPSAEPANVRCHHQRGEHDHGTIAAPIG
jgi:hypothetical protein